MSLYEFMEVIPDAIIVANHAGTIEFVNTAAEAIFDYAPGVLVGQPLEVLMPESMRHRHTQHVQAFLRAPARREMGSRRNLAARRRDGTEFPVEIAISALTLEGKPLVVAAIRDVTAHRARDEVVCRLMEVARIGRLTLDLATDTVEYSQELRELLGLGPDSTPASLFLLIHPDDLSAVPGRRARLIVTGEPERAMVRMRHASGRYLHFEATFSIDERDAQSRRTTIHGLLMDVSERVRLEEAQRATSDQLMVAERMASIGLIAASVAHEINNPLAAVLGNLSIACDDVARLSATFESPILGELSEELRDAREAAERVSATVRDLKVFARHEEKTVQVDVLHVVESTIRMARNEIRHRARLITELEDTPQVDATEARLGQVFLNLLVNAAQAIPEGRAGTHTIKVVLRQDPASQQVIFEVHDTGPGIAPEVVPRLFTPFFTTKPAGVGTGLGLAICRNIIQALRGDIQVESTVGVGTTFRVTLPPSRGEVARPTPLPSTRTATRRGHVLVIDDDQAVAVALRRALQSAHDATIMTEARAALDLLNAGEAFDVILCDLMMPDMTGMDFHAELSRAAPAQAAKVVFVTGGVFTDRARAFLEGLTTPLLDKPYDTAALIRLVNQYVG